MEELRNRDRLLAAVRRNPEMAPFCELIVDDITRIAQRVIGDTSQLPEPFALRARRDIAASLCPEVDGLLGVLLGRSSVQLQDLRVVFILLARLRYHTRAASALVLQGMRRLVSRLAGGAHMVLTCALARPLSFGTRARMLRHRIALARPPSWFQAHSSAENCRFPSLSVIFRPRLRRGPPSLSRSLTVA